MLYNLNFITHQMCWVRECKGHEDDALSNKKMGDDPFFLFFFLYSFS